MTEKLYYSEPYLREVEATIAKIDFLNGKEAELILDKTIFIQKVVVNLQIEVLSSLTIIKLK